MKKFLVVALMAVALCFAVIQYVHAARYETLSVTDLTVLDDATIAGDLAITGSLTGGNIVPGCDTFENGATILNDEDNEIEFAENSEDVSMVFSSNTMTWATDTAVATMAFGVVDDLTGIGSIAFDQAASTISLAANGAADDLTIQVTGAQNASLALASAGTGADAVSIQASAGGLDVDVVDDLILTVASTTDADDFRLIQTGANDSSISVEAAATGTDAIRLQASAGGIDIDALDDLNITVASTTTADDMVIAQTGANNSSILVQAAGTGADAISLQASAGGIDIDALDDLSITVASTTTADDLVIAQTGGNNSSILVQAAGTGADAISLQASAGGVDIDAVDDIIITVASTAGADDLVIAQTGAQDASVHVQAAGTGADAITLQASAGGIDIDAVDDINIAVASTAGGDDLVLAQTGAQDASIALQAAGTGADAISIQASAGGVDIDAVDDVIITVASTAGADDLSLVQTGAQDASILLTAAGTGADAIGLTTSAGGVTVTSATTILLEGATVLNTVQTFGESDETPDVSGYSYFITHATTDTITDFDGSGIVAGQLLVIESAGAITYDVTSSGLKGGSTDIVTADGDQTTWIYNGTDWLLMSFMDLSDDMS